MKQHADNLANRLLNEFQNIENLSIDRLEKLAKKIEVSNILVQELHLHVTRYKLISSEKEQITYFKYWSSRQRHFSLSLSQNRT